MPVEREDDSRSAWQRAREDHPTIAQIEAAAEDTRPIVLWVYTNSLERRMERAAELSQQFYNDVLQNAYVTQQLQHCLCLKIEGEDMDRQLARQYDIRRNRYPQVLIYDFEGRSLSQLGSCSVDQMIEALESAIEHCENLAEYRDAQDDEED